MKSFLYDESYVVSFIIPVYNKENLIEKCLKSITSQTLSNLDIIVVDDGSTDKSGFICDDLARLDTRIKVIHQQNSGVAGAINTGLNNVTGDFILFVDSDDYIAPEMTERLLNAAQLYKADIVQCDRYSFRDIKGLDFSEQTDRIQVFEGTHQILDDFFHYKTISRNLAARLISKHLFDGVRCETGRLVVDVVTVPQLLIKCSKYVYLSGKYYYVYEDPTSVTRGVFSEQRYSDALYGLQFFDDFVRANCPEFISYLFFRHIDVAIYCYKVVYKNITLSNRADKLSYFKNDFHKYIRGFKNSEYFKEKTILYKMKVNSFILNPNLYIFIEKLIDNTVLIGRRIKGRKGR